LFAKNGIGHCYHQLPFTKKQERADFYIASVDRFIVLTSLLPEQITRKNIFQRARMKSTVFAIRADETKKQFNVQIFFPNKVHLYVGVSIDSLIRRIFIHTYNPPSRILLCLLYVAVHYLIQNPIGYDEPCVEPVEGLQLFDHLSYVKTPCVQEGRVCLQTLLRQ